MQRAVPEQQRLHPRCMRPHHQKLLAPEALLAGQSTKRPLHRPAGTLRHVNRPRKRPIDLSCRPGDSLLCGRQPTGGRCQSLAAVTFWFPVVKRSAAGHERDAPVHRKLGQPPAWYSAWDRLAWCVRIDAGAISKERRTIHVCTCAAKWLVVTRWRDWPREVAQLAARLSDTVQPRVDADLTRTRHLTRTRRRSASERADGEGVQTEHV